MASNEQIIEALKLCLDRELEGDYVFIEDEQMFQAKADTRSVMGEVTTLAVVTENGYITYTAVGPVVEPELRAAAAEFITRANHGLPNGNFELDMNEGILNFKVYTPCYELPPDDLIRDSFVVPVAVLHRYGGALCDVLLHGKEPEEAIAEAEKEKFKEVS